MEATKHVYVVVVAVVGLLIAQAAPADTISWKTGVTGNWDVPANWVGDALPGAGDTGVIPSGEAATANVTLTGDPLVEVESGGRLSIRDNSGTTVTNRITVKGGASLWGRRGGDIGTRVVFEDGSTYEQAKGAVGLLTNEITLNGVVTFTRRSTDALGRFLPMLVGTGTAVFDAFAVEPGSADTFSIGGGNTGYSGDVIVEAGVLNLDRNAGTGVFTSGDIIVRPGATLNVSFLGSNIQAFSDTTVLWVESSSPSGKVIYSDLRSSSAADTLLGMVLGGTPVPAGVYTTSDLEVLFPGFITTRSRGEDVDYTFTVLTTVELPSDDQAIPEPATALLVGAGLFGLIRRRRGMARRNKAREGGTKMPIARPVRLGVVVLIAGLLCVQSAPAGTIDWEGGQGPKSYNLHNWTLTANWSPDWNAGGPGPGDDAIIGDGTTAVEAWADGQLSGGDPASVLVKNNALFVFGDNKDVFATPTTVTVESGGVVRGRRFPDLDATLVMQDGATGRPTDGGGLGNKNGPAIVIQSGDVTFDGGDSNPASSPFRSSIAARLTGPGNVHMSPDAAAMQISLGGGNDSFTGDFIVEQGEVKVGRDTRTGLLTQGDVIVREGATLYCNFRSHEPQPFTGLSFSGQPDATSTTTLWLEGTGASQAQLIYTDAADRSADTLWGMVLGGVPVPEGVYTMGQLDALFPGYIEARTSSGVDVTYTLHVLNTVEIATDDQGIPEPTSAALLGLGVVAMIRRRRRA